MITLFLWFFVGFPFEVPEEVSRISFLYENQEAVYFIESNTAAFFKISASGQEATYKERGPAPWELMKPNVIRSYRGQILVPDWAKRSVFFFTPQLEHIKTHNTNWLCRDVAYLNGHFYLVAYDAQSGTMIQKMDDNFKRVKGFGKGLDDPRLLGNQSGYLALYRDTLIFQHSAFPYWQQYDTDGNLLKTVLFPGFEQEPFLSFDVFLGKADKTPSIMVSQGIQGHYLKSIMRDYTHGKDWLYSTNLETGEVQKQGFHLATLILAQNGQAYQQHIGDDRVHLTAIK